MFEQLEKLIKADQNTQESFLRIKKEYQDRNKAKGKELLKKARLQAIVLGSSTVISILFLIFAFNTKTVSENEQEKLRNEISQLNTKLEDCN